MIYIIYRSRCGVDFPEQAMGFVSEIGARVNNQTSHSPQRRSFLKGQFDLADQLRPPGAITSLAFGETCTRCGDCAAQCPQAIITADDDGFPLVDLSRRACTFCGTCAEVCDVGAILPSTGWEWRAQPTQSCLSVQGITCRTCEDHCDAQAIRFTLMTAGRSEPTIDQEHCTGCGACMAACPTGAIILHHPKTDLDASQFQPARHTQDEHLRMPSTGDT